MRKVATNITIEHNNNFLRYGDKTVIVCPIKTIKLINPNVIARAI